MKVIKKDGRLQEFNKDKLVTSLANASGDSQKAELNESDIKIICSDIISVLEKIRKEDSYTSSYEIIGVITNILKKDGFVELLKSYLEH